MFTIGRLLLQFKWSKNGLFYTQNDDRVHPEKLYDLASIKYVTAGDGKAIQIIVLKASVIMGWI